ncbi:MAG: hypothetical protein KYX69_19800 [Sphingomonas sp.]|uniref:hypothetical protein n=1 Tax=Sphingomonas sp. TaxID=28214 RepID=UPI00261BD906|nr:hypothetical protein [Sphingomonas sp.]MDK2769949.1 hypothetical protein [Sphingomonas sp.]
MTEIPADVLQSAREAIAARVHEPSRGQYLSGQHDSFAVIQACAAAILAERQRAARVVANHNRKGREWIPDSLWGSLTREAVRRIESGEPA